MTSVDREINGEEDSVEKTGSSPENRAKGLVEELYDFRDKYFQDKEINERTAELKVVQVAEKLQQTLRVLDECDWDQRDKALYHLYVGKTLNVVSEYDVKCQENLTKAIKLNPKLSEAWYQLGECHWKNNDIDGAYNCFKSALEYQSDKHILRAMSMIIRQLPSSSQSDKKNQLAESVNKAKEALKLDMNDGKSWAILGSAYLNSFLGYPFNPKSMSRALSAYHKAIQDPIANTDPDLHYNNGIALQYESSFDASLKSWCFASCLDTVWKFPKDSINQTVNFLDNLLSSIQSRGKMKEKRFRQLLSSLKDPKTRDRDLAPYLGGKLNSSIQLKQLAFKDLQDGVNSNSMVLAKVICGVVHGDQLAYTIIIVDEHSDLMPLRIFNLGQGKGPVIGDSVVIPEPYLEKIFVSSDTMKKCNEELNGSKSIFKTDNLSAVSPNLLENGIDLKVIRVSIPNVLVVNGRKINNQWTALPVVQNLYFTETWLSSMN